MVKNILMITDHFMRYTLAVVMKEQAAKTVTKVFYKHFIAVFGVPAKLLSDRGANFTCALVEKLCAAFGIQKCQTTAYHGQVECFHQWLFFSPHLQTAFFLLVRMVECLLVFLLRPECALVLGNGCERLCASRPLLGSYIHQESI